MRTLKEKDFVELAKEFNKMRVELAHKQPLSSKELVEAFKVYGFPTSSIFIACLVEYKILIHEGNKYTVATDPIHWMTYEKAYKAFRVKRNTYTKKKSSVVSARIVKVSPAPDNSLESQIQAAIKLLKSQGDRFKITEKVVTVEMREL